MMGRGDGNGGLSGSGAGAQRSPGLSAAGGLRQGHGLSPPAKKAPAGGPAGRRLRPFVPDAGAFLFGKSVVEPAHGRGNVPGGLWAGKGTDSPERGAGSAGGGLFRGGAGADGADVRPGGSGGPAGLLSCELWHSGAYGGRGPGGDEMGPWQADPPGGETLCRCGSPLGDEPWS